MIPGRPSEGGGGICGGVLPRIHSYSHAGDGSSLATAAAAGLPLSSDSRQANVVTSTMLPRWALLCWITYEVTFNHLIQTPEAVPSLISSRLVALPTSDCRSVPCWPPGPPQLRFSTKTATAESWVSPTFTIRDLQPRRGPPRPPRCSCTSFCSSGSNSSNRICPVAPTT